MAQRNCKLLNWNVRGLNDAARRDAVSELVRDTGATIVCLQETKLQQIDANIVMQTVGQCFANSFAALPAVQTRGGILLAVNEGYFGLSDVRFSQHAITATITMRDTSTQWQITVVYGPQNDDEKVMFLQELKSITAPQPHRRWLIMGDFNLIYQAQDKNNTNLNRRLMGSFKATIDELGLKEISLNGRRFTWTNEQANPTMTRIDRLLCTPEWELLFPSCFLHSLPSLMSDHTPLLLHGALDHFSNNFFRFENFWTKIDGFQEVVQAEWGKPANTTLPIKRFHIEMARLAKMLKKWRKEKIGNTRLQLAITKEILLQLEMA
jgi:exonuclease III